MAETEKTKRLTEYVILKQIEKPETFTIVGLAEAASARAAVQAAAGEQEGRFLAVPSTSFNLFDAQVTVPAPVFRLTEVEALPPAVEHSVKTPQPETLPAKPPLDPSKPMAQQAAFPAASASEAEAPDA